MLGNNLQHSLTLLKKLVSREWYNNKTKLILISSRQKKKCMRDKLALVYDNFDLQLTTCEKVLGVHIDDNLTWTSHFLCFKKDIFIPLAFVSDKTIPFITTQCYFTMLILSLTLNIVVRFEGIYLILYT